MIGLLALLNMRGVKIASTMSAPVRLPAPSQAVRHMIKIDKSFCAT